MKFVDLAKIYVKSGDGGRGHVSFRTEKFVPKGGPDGGNGGKGGDVIALVDPHLNTLLDLRYKRHYKAEKGKPGQKSRKSGKSGKNIIIKIPRGTIIRNADSGELLADLAENDYSFVIAKGGRGGLGNAEFATPTNQAPRYAQPGEEGIELNIELELKLIADIGIVGFPNAGKSTLISVISAAKPKIADYPFTTLIPNLGIVKVGDYKSYTVADIPGLIEGASDGKGLGIQFLRHVERTRALLFLIEAFSNDPVNDFDVLYNELIKYNPDMKHKKKIICISKADTVDEDRINELKNIDFPNYGKPFIISSVTSMNVDKLKWIMWENIEKD